MAIASTSSNPQPHSCDIPQRSAFGPVFFNIYILPLGDIILSCNSNVHLYADDTQLYLALDHPVFAPILLGIYTSPLGDVILSHSTQVHLYADDTQPYLALDQLGNSDTSTDNPLFRCMHCRYPLMMPLNRLELNDNKPSFLSLSFKLHVPSVTKVGFFQVGGSPPPLLA